MNTQHAAQDRQDQQERQDRHGSAGGTAVLLAAHGDRGEDKSNATTLSHSQRLAAQLPECWVGCGFLNGDPDIADALREAARHAGNVLVYPLFMSDGYFTNTLLPKRLAEAGADVTLTILPPFGFDPALPTLCAETARAAAGDAGIDPANGRMLIVGHGSTKSRASKGATDCFAHGVRDLGTFGTVETCFLEEAPFLKEALASSPLPTVVIGYFAGDGLHAAEDVPEAIETTGSPAVYAGSLGALPQIADLARGAVAAHDARQKGDGR